jgi:hypothetical protein
VIAPGVNERSGLDHCDALMTFDDAVLDGLGEGELCAGGEDAVGAGTTEEHALSVSTDTLSARNHRLPLDRLGWVVESEE